MQKGADANGLTLFEYNKNYDTRIIDLLKSLTDGKYKTGILKGFPKSKPGKKTKRLIGISLVNDRIVQKAILFTINPYIMPFLQNGVSFGCISKKGIVRSQFKKEAFGIQGACANLITGIENENFWIFKSDIISFYDSIPKVKLYKKVISLLPDNSLDKLIKDIIYARWWKESEAFKELPIPDNHIGIAQGPPLSPAFSNIYLIEFDRAMKDIYGTNYIRYADDFIVMTKSEVSAHEAKKIAEKLLLKEKLRLSPEESKTKIVNLKKDQLVFLGLKFTRHKIYAKNHGEIILKTDKILGDRSLGEKEKVKKFNNFTKGIFGAYNAYHSEKLFTEINKKVEWLHKKKKMGYLSLFLGKMKPIISEEKWTLYFQKKHTEI